MDTERDRDGSGSGGGGAEGDPVGAVGHRRAVRAAALQALSVAERATLLVWAGSAGAAVHAASPGWAAAVLAGGIGVGLAELIRGLVPHR